MNSKPLFDEECLQFEERVQELLDQRISPLSDSKVAQHAAQCPECTKLLQSFWVLSQTYDSRNGFPNPDKSRIPASTKAGRSDHSLSHAKKIVWSFGPSFAALLFVGVAIYFSNRPNYDHELVDLFEVNRQTQMVLAKDSNSAGPDADISRFFSGQGIPDVTRYPISVYQIALETKDWTDFSGKKSQQLIKRISKPLTPIQPYVPTEVSVFVELQNYFGVAWRLLKLSLGNMDDNDQGDRNWHPIPLDWNVA